MYLNQDNILKSSMFDIKYEVDNEILNSEINLSAENTKRLFA